MRDKIYCIKIMARLIYFLPSEYPMNEPVLRLQIYEEYAVTAQYVRGLIIITFELDGTPTIMRKWSWH